MSQPNILPNISLEQLVPYFQPIMDLSNQAVWRYETLARMITPEQQTFTPCEFLYLVERELDALGQTMFSRSAEYFRDLNMAWNINLSTADMRNPLLARQMTEVLANYPNPSRVGVELAAQSALDAPQAFRAFLLFCKTLDIKVFLDHIDQRSTTNNKLWDLPIDGIKVNGQIILQLAVQQRLNEWQTRLQDKGISLIAEQIEHQETLAQLQKLGIQYAQGFYFSQPSAQV